MYLIKFRVVRVESCEFGEIARYSIELGVVRSLLGEM